MPQFKEALHVGAAFVQAAALLQCFVHDLLHKKCISIFEVITSNMFSFFLNPLFRQICPLNQGRFTFPSNVYILSILQGKRLQQLVYYSSLQRFHSTAHCPSILRIKTEPVTVGADATVQLYANHVYCVSQFFQRKQNKENKQKADKLSYTVFALQ